MKKLTGVITGIILVVCGIVYALGILGICDINISLDGWWTLFIILPCLNGLVKSKDKFGNLIGILIGILLLLAARDVLEYSVLWVVVPVIVIMLGIKIIVKSVSSSDSSANGNIEKDVKEHTAVFSETVVDYAGEEINAAKIGAVFGGVKCNLINAEITKKSQIDVLCAFGGAEIVVPENVNIKNNVFCLFGGMSDKRAVTAANADDLTLTVNGFCIFGGVDIK